jgi:hypothetical protein
MSVKIYRNDKEIEHDLVRSPSIEIGGSAYKEIINAVYEIPYRKPRAPFHSPDLVEDDHERQYLMKRIDDCIVILLAEDRNSRRAVYANLYPSEMCKCICLVHLFLRDQKLYINEYYRSQNYQRNYGYDCDTACMLMEKALGMINKYCAFEVDKVTAGSITVFCSNLHIKVK